MANETGAVRFIGDPGTVCDDALNYTVTDSEGNEVDTSILSPDYVVSGIPQEELKRWVLNQNFIGETGNATKAQDELSREVATRINGVVIDQEAAAARLEAEAARNKPLEEMSKAELQEKADEQGVEYAPGDTKAELIEKIDAGAAAAYGDGEPQDPPPDGTVTEQGEGQTVAGEENN